VCIHARFFFFRRIFKVVQERERTCDSMFSYIRTKNKGKDKKNAKCKEEKNIQCTHDGEGEIQLLYMRNNFLLWVDPLSVLVCFEEKPRLSQCIV